MYHYFVILLYKYYIILTDLSMIIDYIKDNKSSKSWVSSSVLHMLGFKHVMYFIISVHYFVTQIVLSRQKIPSLLSPGGDWLA